MHLSFAAAGLVIGVLVGLTGMAGGALLIPLLVLVFRVGLLAAISSDLLTSLVMKPVGAVVHLRRGSVNWPLVGWLASGSVPAAFGGAALIGAVGHTQGMQHYLKPAIATVLCVSVGATMFRQLLDHHRRHRGDHHSPPLAARPLRAVSIGVLGGFAVGMTSVGAGSLIIAMLLIAYPQLRPAHLVGTDITQAIPLVAAATIGHVLFGEVRLAVTGSLLLGALPGVYLGARLSAEGPAHVIRSVVATALLASALALWNVTTSLLLTAVIAALVVMTLCRRLSD